MESDAQLPGIGDTTAPATERLQTVHTEAVEVGLERVVQAAQRAVERVDSALTEEPGLVASTTLQLAADELADRQQSLARAEMPSDSMGTETWEAQRSKGAVLLQQAGEHVAEVAAAVAAHADIAAAAAADAEMAEHFRPLVPPPPKPPAQRPDPKNGGGRRDGAGAPRGGRADDDQPRAAAPPGAAAAAAAAAAQKGGKGGGKGGPPGGGKGRRADDPPKGPPAGKGGGYDDEHHGAQQGGHTCWVDGCGWAGKNGAATPQSLATHVAYKHGDAPHRPEPGGGRSAAWTAKQQWATQQVSRQVNVRPGEPRWHVGNHVGAGGGGKQRRDGRER